MAECGADGLQRTALRLGLLGWVAVASASRIVPESAALGRSVARPSVVHPTLDRPLTGLQMAGSDEVPDPFGVRMEVKPSPLNIEVWTDPDASARISVEMDNGNRVAGRGGASAESWRVGEGETAAVIKNIKIRTEQDYFAAKNELNAIRKMLGRGVFLNVHELRYKHDGDVPMELMLMTEDYTCTLKELLKQNRGKLDALTMLDLIVDIDDDLEELRRNGIAHDAPTTSDILIVGDSKDLSSCRAVLSSSLANTNMRIRSSQVLQGPRVQLRSMEEVEMADFEGLELVFDAMELAVPNEEHDKLVQLTSSVKRAEHIGNGLKQLRSLLLLERPPKDVAKRITTRHLETADEAEVSTKGAQSGDEVVAMAQAIKDNMKEVARLMREVDFGDVVFDDVVLDDKVDEPDAYDIASAYMSFARK